MSLKAGRVGVNPSDVDPVSGHISPDATDSYTKAQADDKFLNKSDASSTYETKTEASTAHNLLQPKTLAVPIKYLQGSVLGLFNTVEEALSGSYGADGAMTNKELTDNVIIQKAQFTLGQGMTLDDVNWIVKQGKIVSFGLQLKNVTSTAWSTVLATIPEGFRPENDIRVISSAGNYRFAQIEPSGNVKAANTLTSEGFLAFYGTYITA